jgi:hypothetical protein
MRTIIFKLSPFLLLLGLVVLYALRFGFASPSHDRDWKHEFSRLPLVERHDGLITIRDIRDWRYDEEAPVSMRWTDRRIDLETVERVWFLMEPFEKWDAIAHTFLIFDFRDAPPIAFSIEARGEIGEEFNPLAGATRHYELSYLFGTEEDFLVRRAVTLGNRLYMYPVSASEGFPKRLLSDLLDQTEELSRTPRFYNTFRHNCTNALAASANRATRGAIPWHLSFVLPGYSPDYLRKLGYIPGMAAAETDDGRYRIDDIVRELSDRNDFSEALRERSAARRGL